MSSLSAIKAAIVFGTDTGNTEEVGEKIKTLFDGKGVEIDMLNVTEASATVMEMYDFLILGIPTWDFGGIQQDWEDFEEELLTADLSSKVVALYGLGDQFGYSDYFLDAMGWLYERVLKTEGKVIGFWSTEGYEFDASLAVNDDKTMFCGLGIDEDQQFELSDQRIEAWVEQLEREFSELLAA